jgi:arginase family enzyme
MDPQFVADWRDELQARVFITEYVWDETTLSQVLHLQGGLRKLMDRRIWEDAYRRAAEITPVRVDRRMRDILYGDVPTFMELPHAVKSGDLESADAAFLGMGYEGVKIDSPHTYLPDLAAPAGPDSIYYRTGADRAPEAVRRYSIHYSIHHAFGLFIEYAPDFYIFKHLRAVDAGDVPVIPGDPETSFQRCEARVRDIVAAGAVPLVCGGDHAITLPVVKAVAGAMAGRLGLIHLDSHYDLCWDPPLFAGSQWAQILRLANVAARNFCQIGIRGLRQVPFEVEVAQALGHTVLTMADVDRDGVESAADVALARACDGTEGVYVSLDVDVLDPAYCPAQKYPEPAGLTSKQIITLLRRIGQQAEIRGFDLCCLGPQYDDRVGTGSHLAARLFVEILATLAWRRRT